MHRSMVMVLVRYRMRMSCRVVRAFGGLLVVSWVAHYDTWVGRLASFQWELREFQESDRVWEDKWSCRQVLTRMNVCVQGMVIRPSAKCTV